MSWTPANLVSIRSIFQIRSLIASHVNNLQLTKTRVILEHSHLFNSKKPSFVSDYGLIYSTNEAKLLANLTLIGQEDILDLQEDQVSNKTNTKKLHASLSSNEFTIGGATIGE